MITVNNATKAALVSDSVLKSLKITIPSANITLTNEDIVTESLKLSQSIEESSALSFKGCTASCLEIDCVDLSADVRGKEIIATIKAGNTQEIPLFRGIIQQQLNRTHEDILTKLTAYDKLYTASQTDVTDWYNSLTFPMTVKALRDALCTQLGITQESVTLPNDSVSLSKTIKDENINGLTLLRWICQINARFGQINASGTFKYRRLLEIVPGLYPAEDLYPANDLYPADESATALIAKATYTALEYEPFDTAKIGKVVIIGEDGTSVATAGNGTNAFYIADNPLAYAMQNTAQAAQTILSQISFLWYTPAEVDAVGLPYLECGDSIYAASNKYICRTYILSRNLNGIQNLLDTYTSNSDQYQPSYEESTETKVTRNNLQTEENATEIVNAKRLTVDMVDAEKTRTNTLVADTVRAERVRTDTLVADSISAEATRTNTLVANSIDAEATRTNTLVANSISASETRTDALIATKASVSDLNATNATISQLNTEIVNTNTVVAQKANITDLNATNARVGTLEANAITTSYLDANDIRVKSLYAWGGNIQGTALIGSVVNCDSIYMGSQTATWQSKTINGVTIEYLGR